jgi:carboxyl-terminal processing protease
LKPLDATDKGEAGLRGHLKSDDGEEQDGSSSYVPEEKANDKQLQLALALLHGKQVTLPARQVSQ